jgi:hypothetical protein
MTIVKIRREEIALVKAAGERVARRTHSRFIVDQNRVEVTEENESDEEEAAGDVGGDAARRVAREQLGR